MDWRHIGELLAAAKQVELAYFQLAVWAKSNAGMGGLYRSQHELVAVFKKGRAPHRNNVDLGRHGRNRTNVWTYAGANSFGARRDQELAMHPTVKPVAMLKDIILDCTNHSDWVLDPFAGSGSTLIAAEACARRCAAIEIDLGYCDVILERFERATGIAPMREEPGNE
jgi:DNA modification methylase